MLRKSSNFQVTFITRAIRGFTGNISGGFARANEWRKDSIDWVKEKLTDFYDWEKEHKIGIIISLAVIIFVGLLVWFIVDVTRGRVDGNAFQIGVGGVIGGAILSAVASPLIALVAFLATLLINQIFRLLAPVFLFLPFIIWTPIYALVQAVIVIAKLLLLIPLFILFVTTRLIQLWRGIFYTCPSRNCAYRGLPDYVCPKCSEPNSKLWPNLYGLLWHYCVKCDNRLPTLGVLGRKELEQLCGDCGMPLLGQHAGRAPERLVSIVGGPDSGKTNYLLMAVNEVINGDGNGAVRIRGEIDDKGQEEEFQREWKNLAIGLPAAKTAEVSRAFLLYAKVGKSRCQLYLYDAPGEEFTSISSMTKQQYFPLLEGFILLVDPLSFEFVRSHVSGLKGEVVPLQDVVTSTVNTALSGIPSGRSGKFPLRVAVTISKADMECVKDQIGDLKQGSIPGETCREAILRWGGDNAIRAIENRFESVEYFACSPLGRDVDSGNREPFKGIGILEPLAWVLADERN